MAMNPDLIRARARHFLADFSTGQKTVLVALVAVLLVGGYAFTSWASKPSYAPLFSNISAEDASSITSKLNSKNVPYKLTDAGKTIMVPQSQVYQLRVDMSAQGLPSGGGGYALLDKQGITASEFRQRIDYQRALEGEIGKTISSIDGIEGASVHLVIPKDDVFADDSRKPSASVLVMTAAGTKLSSNQVQAIVNLTSSSIEGLSPDMVTVADSRGNVLSAPGQAGADAGGDQRTGQTREFETNLASNVQDYLSNVFGPNHAFVRVNADLDFDKKQTTTESYDNTAQAPTLSEDTSTETFSGNGNSAVGGILGPDATVSTPSADGNSNYSKTQGKKDFGVNKIVESVNAAPGQVKRLSVAVMVDSKVSGASLASIKNQVAAAAGIDPTRGDTIAVDSMAFDTATAEATEKALKAEQSKQSKDGMMNLISRVLMFLLIVIVVVLGVIFGKKRSKRLADGTPIDIRELEAVRRPSLNAAGAGFDGSFEVDGTYSLDELPDASPLGVTAQGAERIQLEGQIGELIEKQPDEVASLLRTWLADRRG